MENKVEITKQEARDLVERCLKVLYYRDARSYNRVSPRPRLSFSRRREGFVDLLNETFLFLTSGVFFNF